MVMDTLSDQDRARIRDAIAEAEAKTAGEIFVVVAGSSDDYRLVALLWATLAVLFVPLPLIFLTLTPALHIYLAQLAIFVVVSMLLSLPPLHIAVVPHTLKKARAHARAVEQFLAHGLHTTEARTGVLIFVSLAERYAEIIADTGIAAKVEQSVWDEAIAGLIAETRAGRLGEGLLQAIARAGAVLAAHFPPRPGDVNELPNDLILL
jgi:putative membrane protein